MCLGCSLSVCTVYEWPTRWWPHFFAKIATQEDAKGRYCHFRTAPGACNTYACGTMGGGLLFGCRLTGKTITILFLIEYPHPNHLAEAETRYTNTDNSNHLPQRQPKGCVDKIFGQFRFLDAPPLGFQLNWTGITPHGRWIMLSYERATLVV